MSYDYTAGEIRKRLEDNLESMLNTYWPGWIRVGSKALLTPKLKGTKQTSSFQVDMAGQHRGRWYRHSQEVGGGPLELLYYGQTGRVPGDRDRRDAFDRARGFLGLPQARTESDREREERERRAEIERIHRQQRAAIEEKERRLRLERRAATAAEICAEMQEIAGTQAEAYLVARGLPPVSEWPWNPRGILGFVPELDYELDRSAGLLPAFVARVQNAFDETTAVWQIYLDLKRPAKNERVPNCKVGRGSPAGGAVRLGGHAARIGVAEGIESALGNWCLEAWRMPVWSTLSTSGMQGFEPPLFVKRVDLYPDGDLGIVSVRRDEARTDRGRVRDPPGLHAAKALASRLKPLGLLGTFNDPAPEGDGLDIWNAVNSCERSIDR